MDTDDFNHNRLAAATSPYLRQHAGNPVHWQPWDDAALAHARETDTPILLSIGYSACHWCHVMAHECFADDAIAAAMNAGFVNIKLDREERPDIDRVYQLAHQALNGRGGGWPLTCFLDPQDLAPFYVGTYFPPTPRHGLPGFVEVLRRVRAYFDAHRDELRAQSGELRAWMQAANTQSTSDTIDAAHVQVQALDRIRARFDMRHGGSVGAPKFPHPPQLEWLLDQRGDEAQAMARLTLERMATRGLQDHLGGGFFRYCVDADWTIPHFEKMLYDNAQLLPVYARLASSPKADPAMRTTALAAATGIIDWLARDMLLSAGTFCSALDADSEHEEGKFYLWTRAQLHAALPTATSEIAGLAFGLVDPPNFEGHAWHLLRTRPLDEIAGLLVQSPAAVVAEFARARQQLFAAREHREHPQRDDKVLTAWNALTIAGLARTARLLGDARAATLAQRALDAVRAGAWVDGRLCANVAAPGSRIPGFLDDHAFLLDAVLEVLQLEFTAREIDFAIALADALLDRFEDRERGGFWFSTPEHATPLARSRDWTDEALPNGNAVAIRALLRLGHLVGDTRYLDAVERALRAASGALTRYPDACPSLLRVLAEYEHPRTQVVVRCESGAAAPWRANLGAKLRDDVDVFVIAGIDVPLPGVLDARTARGPGGSAYVCSGLACRTPIDDPAELAGALREALSASH